MALEWLKTILGEGYTDTVDAAISAEIGKNFVPKADFNAKNEGLKALTEQLKERDTQLEKLKGAAGNTEELTKQIAALQEANAKDKANYEARIAAIRLENAVDTALTAAGAKNNTAAKALLAEFLKNAKIAEDGTVNGLTKAIEGLASDESTSFLFAQKAEVQLSGMKPGDPGGKAPGAPAGSAEDYRARLEAARKSGNNVAAIAVKREAAEKGITLF